MKKLKVLISFNQNDKQLDNKVRTFIVTDTELPAKRENLTYRCCLLCET